MGSRYLHLVRMDVAHDLEPTFNETPYVFWVFMDVEKHREQLFNELYDTEHVPLLLKLPGCVNVARFRTEAAGEPRYLAAYEVDRTDLPMSKLWNDTSDIGRWKPEVRPYTHNKHYIVGERIWPKYGRPAPRGGETGLGGFWMAR